MKREIKFRAWHTEKKLMFSAMGMAIDQMTLLPTGQFINVHSNPKLSEIDHEGVMIPLQYTGLKDKNGVEIYEGDIGEMQMINEFGSQEIKRGVMEMHPNGFWSFKTESEYDLDKTSPPIVIGNIYENPDLLSPFPPKGEGSIS